MKMRVTDITVQKLMENIDRLILVSFNPGDEEDTTNYNFLAVDRQPDGRFDLVDAGCGDTGTDIAEMTLGELFSYVQRWLGCLGDDDSDSTDYMAEFRDRISPHLPLSFQALWEQRYVSLMSQK